MIRILLSVFLWLSCLIAQKCRKSKLISLILQLVAECLFLQLSPALAGLVGNFLWMLVVIQDALQNYWCRSKAVGNHRISDASDVGLFLAFFCGFQRSLRILLELRWCGRITIPKYFFFPPTSLDCFCAFWLCLTVVSCCKHGFVLAQDVLMLLR